MVSSHLFLFTVWRASQKALRPQPPLFILVQDFVQVRGLTERPMAIPHAQLPASFGHCCLGPQEQDASAGKPRSICPAVTMDQNRQLGFIQIRNQSAQFMP